MDKSKLRLAASSPNIKALFDANPTSYGYRDSQQPQQEGGYPGFYPPVPPIPQQHQQQYPPHSQLPPHPQQQGEYQWAPPRQMVRYLYFSEADFRADRPPLQPYPAAPGYNAGGPSYAPQHATRLSHDETRNAVANVVNGTSPAPSSDAIANANSSAPANNGASEPAATGPSVESKLKEIARQPRSLAGRAQSLDLSSHATARHVPTPSVDQVSNVFSGLGLR